MKERLTSSHDKYSRSLDAMERARKEQLEDMAEKQTTVRKSLAPKVARLALQSTSLVDYLNYGAWSYRILHESKYHSVGNEVDKYKISVNRQILIIN